MQGCAEPNRRQRTTTWTRAFCGEPIDQLSQYTANGSPVSGSEPRMNRITIRLQRSGKQIESNDALYFDW